MLETWGDGESCPCVHCGGTVFYETVQADRIVPGGPYARHNVQPACEDCNRDRSCDVSWTRHG